MSALADSNRPIKWLDGIRGLASLIVVITHLARAFDPKLFDPSDSETASPRFFQWPIIRIFPQGRIGVTIFSLLVGFVCALKPLRQIRDGKHDEALSGIAKAAFRRIPRLVFPTTIATVLIWMVCQMGGFKISHHVESFWVGNTSPWREEGGLIKVLKLLGYNVVVTWTHGWNIYDGNIWTLWPLFKGSMMVWITMVGTVYVTAKARMLISLLLFAYYYISSDSAFGMQFFWGMFLACLSTHQPAMNCIQNHKVFGRVLGPLLIGIGLFIASFPEGRYELTRWSNFLYKALMVVLPPDADIPRFSSGIGLEFISLGIVFSKAAQDALSSKFLLFLGRNSFAVYLLHGTLLRIVLCWMLFGTRIPLDVVNEAGQIVPGQPLRMIGFPSQVVAILVWFVLLYLIADRWTTYVDPMCVRWGAKLEKLMVAEKKVSLPK